MGGRGFNFRGWTKTPGLRITEKWRYCLCTANGWPRKIKVTSTVGDIKIVSPVSSFVLKTIHRHSNKVLFFWFSTVALVWQHHPGMGRWRYGTSPKQSVSWPSQTTRTLCGAVLGIPVATSWHLVPWITLQKSGTLTGTSVNQQRALATTSATVTRMSKKR